MGWGAYHIFGGALANKFGLLDQAPENGTHPWAGACALWYGLVVYWAGRSQHKSTKEPVTDYTNVS